MKLVREVRWALTGAVVIQAIGICLTPVLDLDSATVTASSQALAGGPASAGTDCIWIGGVLICW